MHEKERAIRPPFRRHLNMMILVTSDLDTDQFGTFTGEIRRKGTASETALQKAKCATELMGTRFGLGSEGSFTSHPQIPFLQFDQEVMAFYDRDQDINIIEYLGTHRTNYAYTDFKPHEDISEFLKTVGFPSHGVILSEVAGENVSTIAKGIRDFDTLRKMSSKDFFKEKEVIFRISTDMRAHMNPTRMAVIRALASRLVRRIACLCPSCRAPGFGEKSLERGIPCSWCDYPTQLVRGVRIRCSRCRHEEVEPLNTTEQKADPRHCEYCNP